MSSPLGFGKKPSYQKRTIVHYSHYVWRPTPDKLVFSHETYTNTVQYAFPLNFPDRYILTSLPVRCTGMSRMSRKSIQYQSKLSICYR